ncbi:MAG: methyltransferase domain-containing protein [Gemmataceae bacterium]
MTTTLQDEVRLDRERAFFDRVAGQAQVARMPAAVLERYAKRPHARLFGKEFMFDLAGDLRGKQVLEVGCGEGVAACQLAYCGARVTGIDLSPVSIEVAHRRLALHGLKADFRVADAANDDLGTARFDVVWCDLILHHLVPVLDDVLCRLARALKPGGLFITREPMAYAGWLQRLRRQVPVEVAATPDEQPLRSQEVALVRRHFPGVQCRYFRILARLDRLTGRLPLLRAAARLDNLLLRLPGASSLAGNAVLWARKA